MSVRGAVFALVVACALTASRWRRAPASSRRAVVESLSLTVWAPPAAIEKLAAASVTVFARVRRERPTETRILLVSASVPRQRPAPCAHESLTDTRPRDTRALLVAIDTRAGVASVVRASTIACTTRYVNRPDSVLGR